MRDHADTNSCVRATDLVAYLYGEASEREALDFEGHMRGCASCEAEVEAFGHVRASIGEWRNQTVGSIESHVLATRSPTLDAVSRSARKPSALAALREFFALSPMWMRGATALAGLAICALIVFAAFRLTEEPRVVVMEKVVEKGPSQAEVNAQVDKKVREELALRVQSEDAQQQQQLVRPVSAKTDSPNARAMTSRSVSVPTQASAGRRAPVRVSAQESEQLAQDLQLIPTRDEEDLPRLIDLMDEAN